MKNKKHFGCKNCIKQGRMMFRNDTFICAGLIKHLKIKNDFYRLCISKYGHKYDLMGEEVLAIVNLLTDLLVEHKLKGRKKRKKK